MAFSWPGSRVDSYVIHVYGNASFIDEVVEYCVYHGLESGGGVGQTEEHDCWFVEPFVGDEGCFPWVLQFYQYFVVSLFDVETSKDGAVS